MFQCFLIFIASFTRVIAYHLVYSFHDIQCWKDSIEKFDPEYFFRFCLLCHMHLHYTFMFLIFWWIYLYEFHYCDRSKLFVFFHGYHLSECSVWFSDFLHDSGWICFLDLFLIIEEFIFESIVEIYRVFIFCWYFGLCSLSALIHFICIG